MKLFRHFLVLFLASGSASAADSHLIIDGIYIAPRNTVQIEMKSKKRANGQSNLIFEVRWLGGSRLYECGFSEFENQMAAMNELRKELSEANKLIPLNVINKHLPYCDHAAEVGWFR